MTNEREAPVEEVIAWAEGHLQYEIDEMTGNPGTEEFRWRTILRALKEMQSRQAAHELLAKDAVNVHLTDEALAQFDRSGT